MNAASVAAPVVPQGRPMHHLEGPELEVECPECGCTATARSYRTDTGLVLVAEMRPECLRAHAFCDLWRLYDTLRAAAYAASRVQVFQVRPPPEP